VHHGQTKKPKQRFDFPYEGAEEEYVSPEKASQELKNVATNIAAAAKFTADAINSITRMGGRVDSWLTDWNAGNIAAAAAALITNQVEAYYAWTKPGFYRYKMSQAVTIGTPAQPTTNTFTQLRPPTSKSYYNEPNLPTANPPPLMFVTPEMRTPENSFMIHTWLPDLSSANSPSYAMFVDSGGRLNKDKYRKHMYNLMQLIFETAIKNANETVPGVPYNNPYNQRPTISDSKICIKLMAVGYDDNNRNIKAIHNKDDKEFIGNTFFDAVQDYSMYYELVQPMSVHATVYYHATQKDILGRRYTAYKTTRDSILLRTRQSSYSSAFNAIDDTLNLEIRPMEEFFTLKYLVRKGQIKKTDLLYFVDYY
jgi:hypothetical protein